MTNFPCLSTLPLTRTRGRLAALLVAFALLFVARGARAQMSDTEKKAAARAAYQEGVKLQEEGKAGEALARFEAAQKLFDAPTHLLHVAQCQGLTGRLVEASETYELLARKSLPPGSPDAFIQAQQQGQAELPPLRARIPTLRVTIRQGAQSFQNLQVNVNGVVMPNELLGIARPLNPGVYRFSAHAAGASTPSSTDVPLAEKEQKSIELVLQQGAAPAAVVVAPVPAPYAKNPDQETKPPTSGPTFAGLLLGIRGGAFVPAGVIGKADNGTDLNFSDYATTGGGGGIDLYARVAKMLLLGLTFEYASLGAPKTVAGRTGSIDISASTGYLGVALGIIPNVDRVSFIGDIGLGARSAKQSIKTTPTQEASLGGLDFTFGAGVSIPAGPIRLVPKLAVSVGTFSSSTVNSSTTDIPSANRGTHALVFLGLGGYYSLDFGSKSE
jgi:hypothetical protein